MSDQEVKDILYGVRSFMPIINSNRELREYLDSRYYDIPKEMFTYKEVIWRIFKNIEERPVCRVCKVNPVRFIGSETKDKLGITIDGYRKTCSLECKHNDLVANEKISSSKKNKSDDLKKLEQEKREKTCLERYGERNVFIAKKDKIKETMISRYGGYTLQSKELRKKQEATTEQKYGNKNIFATDYGKAKIADTNLSRYGERHYNMTAEGRQTMSNKATHTITTLRNK